MVEYGIRLPLHLFTQLFLNAINLAPAQLVPNGWGTDNSPKESIFVV